MKMLKFLTGTKEGTGKGTTPYQKIPTPWPDPHIHSTALSIVIEKMHPDQTDQASADP